MEMVQTIMDLSDYQHDLRPKVRWPTLRTCRLWRIERAATPATDPAFRSTMGAPIGASAVRSSHAVPTLLASCDSTKCCAR